MSQSSASQRLDAARKRNRELEQVIADIHPALPYMPAPMLSALATLVSEAYNPSRFTPDLGTHVSGSGTDQTPRSNRAAAHEIERWQAVQYRWAATIIGTDKSIPDEDGNIGKLEAIIYGDPKAKQRRLRYGGKASNHTPVGDTAA